MDHAANAMEPLTYHGYSHTVWSELLHCNSAGGMIDLTVGAGYAAEAALRPKVPCVGLAQTPTHELVVRRYLLLHLWGLMNEPGSAHFEPRLHSLLADDAGRKDPKGGGKEGGKKSKDGGEKGGKEVAGTAGGKDGGGEAEPQAQGCWWRSPATE